MHIITYFCYDTFVHKNSTSGFSLFELLIVLSITVIIAGIVIGVFSIYKRNNDLKLAVERSVNILKDARNKTLTSEGDSQYGVHFEASQVILFAGSSYNPADPSNVVYALPTTVQISSTALVGGGADTIFKRLTGETTQSGTVTFQLIAEATRSEVIDIRSTGIAYVQ